MIGNNIEIGDKVAYNPPYYKGLEVGIITGFTPKLVKVDGINIHTDVIKVYINE